jgi:hypothetical protein
MPKYQIDIVIEPMGREISMGEVAAKNSIEALQWALKALKLEPEETLHSIYAHIGQPGGEHDTECGTNHSPE